ncbi:MAG: tRNA (adenosine(37)-N6)-threonylcarbamoyltransferase complex dimerization subunit type 1 TsaB [Ideonella sp.]
MGIVETASFPALACRLLAFDTATESTSLALVTPSRLLTLDAPGGAKASTQLLPDIRALLEQGGCSLADVDAIAFGCGPGAFTGLRTACSVAQGLAFGAAKPVMPVDSLMLVAESVRDAMASTGADVVWVAQDARMGEIYAAAYRWQGERPERWQTLVAPALYAIDALNERWSRHASTGSVDAVLAAAALREMHAQLRFRAGPALEAGAAISRALALARLSISLWQDGIRLDAAQALPLYLRDKVALTTAERDADRAAKAVA